MTNALERLITNYRELLEAGNLTAEQRAEICQSIKELVVLDKQESKHDF